MDITYIKNKLINYQLSFEDYMSTNGNLVGNISVPTALKQFNKHLTVEEAYYLVANKVFDLANQISFGIPGVLGEEFKRVVNAEDINAFKNGIFEEINWRYMSNAFPEFERSGTFSAGSVSYTPGISGGTTVFEMLNPLSRQIITDIDWEKYDDNYQVMRDRVYLYRNMSNANLGDGTMRVVGATPSGAISTYDHNTFAKAEDLKTLDTEVSDNYSNQIKLQSDFNQVKTDLYHAYATKQYVHDVSFAFPKMKQYDRDVVYTIPTYVIYNNLVYWNLIENNIGNVPGGVSGQGKWLKVSEIVTEYEREDFIYKAGTDLKLSYSNPNDMFYLDVQKLIEAPTLDVNKVFSIITNNTKVPNFKLNEAESFYENLCGSNQNTLKKLYAKKIKFEKGEIKLFSLKNSLENLINFTDGNNLNENIDFEFLEEGHYLHIDSSSIQTGGSNYIKRSDLPNIELRGKARIGYNGGNMTTVNCNWVFLDIGGGGGRYDYEVWDIWLNGNVKQTEFKPKYLNIVGIRFLKDIYEETLNRFVNVVDLTVLGQVVKQIDNTDVFKGEK